MICRSTNSTNPLATSKAVQSVFHSLFCDVCLYVSVSLKCQVVTSVLKSLISRSCLARSGVSERHDKKIGRRNKSCPELDVVMVASNYSLSGSLLTQPSLSKYYIDLSDPVCLGIFGRGFEASKKLLDAFPIVPH